MTGAPTPNAEPRAPLSKQLLLLTAVLVADAEGIGSLTMRKIADRVGVETMSLYHHVANKAEVLDGMVDVVFSEIELPSQEIDWRMSMRRRALSVRSVLLRHPWAIGLMDSRPNAGTATLRHHDAVIGTLRRAGFSVAMAAHAFSVLDSYIYGFVLQEVALPFTSPQELEEVTDGMRQQMPDGEYPYLTELMTEHVLRPGYAYADEFDFGLDLVLDGLAAKAANTDETATDA